MTRHSRAQAVGRSRRNRVARLSAFAVGVVVILIAVGVLAYTEVSERADAPLDQSEAIIEETADEVAVPVDTVRHDTYVEADLGYPATLNPLLARTSSERNVTKLLFRGLIFIDGRGMPVADLADLWEISDDGMTCTVTIDSAARWHDGAPVSASDVVFTIGLIQDPGFPGDRETARFWRAITVERIDDSTVRFHLLEPFAGFINHLTLPVLPKHVLSDVLPSDLRNAEFNWSPVGSGPYRVDTADLEEQIIRLVVAQPSDQIDIEVVEIRYFDDVQAMLEAFQDGEVMGVSYVPFEAIQQAGMLPDGARVFAPAMPGYTALYFNLRHPLFRDAEVRQAVEYAIDRDWIVQEVLAGQASAGSSPIPEPLWYSVPADRRDYDPDEARRLLESSGWRPSDVDGVLEAEGQRLGFSLLVSLDDPKRMAVAFALQEQLQQVGIQVEVQGLPSAEVNAALAARQFTAALFGWHAANGDPDCYQMWHSSQAEQGMNFTGFSNHFVDALLTEARQTADPEERRRLYGEFQKTFAAQVPAVVLYYPRYHFAVSSAVQGADPSPLVDPSDRMRQIPKWRVEVASAEEESG